MCNTQVHRPCDKSPHERLVRTIVIENDSRQPSIAQYVVRLDHFVLSDWSDATTGILLGRSTPFLLHAFLTIFGKPQPAWVWRQRRFFGLDPTPGREARRAGESGLLRDTPYA